MTHGIWVRCSTNWAMPPWMWEIISKGVDSVKYKTAILLKKNYSVVLNVNWGGNKYRMEIVFGGLLRNNHYTNPAVLISRGDYWNRTNVFGFADRRLNHSPKSPIHVIQIGLEPIRLSTIALDTIVSTNSTFVPKYPIWCAFDRWGLPFKRPLLMFPVLGV